MYYNKVMGYPKGAISSAFLLLGDKENDIISACDKHGGAFTFIDNENQFLNGAISLFREEDIGSQFKLYLNNTDIVIDDISIYCDWRTVGNDLVKAMKIYGEWPRANLSRT